MSNPTYHSVFWFRRDLRLFDNHGLYRALKSNLPVIPLFIFDYDILKELQDRDDKRVLFIHQTIEQLRTGLRKEGRDLLVRYGTPENVWRDLLSEYNIRAVFTNHDYEPYAIKRDAQIKKMCMEKGAAFHTFKDQVIFEKSEILTGQGKPYTVYTPYRKSWESKLKAADLKLFSSEQNLENIIKQKFAETPTLGQMGFSKSRFDFPSARPDEKIIEKYDEQRNRPDIKGTTHIGLHLRFGTVSIREIVRKAQELNDTWLSELIWREFFMMILYHYPYVVDKPFRKKYQGLNWRDDEEDFQRWCDGKTGYPIVDAGMRELNETGFMHNRVRMITAGFLTKHLLIDWRWGERYFARKLLDYELASNNGNWQWAAGCGCDAAPYFRIFNPWTQAEKFDPQNEYIQKWVKEIDSDDYPDPMVEHKFARERALSVFNAAVKEKN